MPNSYQNSYRTFLYFSPARTRIVTRPTLKGGYEIYEFAFQRRFGGLRRLAQTLRGTCSMGAADIKAVNQRAIDEALTMLHRGE